MMYKIPNAGNPMITNSIPKFGFSFWCPAAEISSAIVQSATEINEDAVLQAPGSSHHHLRGWARGSPPTTIH